MSISVSDREPNVIDDIWEPKLISLPTSARPIEKLPSFATLTGIKPLDLQIGVFPKQAVPLALSSVLLGQASPAVGNPDIRTYVILDAAKAPGLPAILDAAALDCRCLFKGTAQRDLGEVAPWVVALTERDEMLRMLFTDKDPPLGFWRLEAGIFFRTAMSLDRLQAHLRRFTRLRDNDGTWYYFRFWEPEVMRSFARQADVLSSFWHAFLPDGQVITPDPLLNEALVATRAADDRGDVHPHILLTHEMKSILRQQRIQMFSRRLVRESITATQEPAAECLQAVHAAVLEGINIGLRQNTHLRRFTEMIRRADRGLPGWRGSSLIQHTLSAGHSPARLLTELEYDLEAFGRNKNE